MNADLGLTPDQLRDAVARATKTAISRSTLRRFHQEGLIPRPIQIHSRGRAGSDSKYPPGTLDQLIDLLRLRRETRAWRFADLRLEAWWAGLPVEPNALRETVVEKINDQFAEIRKVSAEEPSPEAAAEVLLRDDPASSRSPIVRLMRQRVGSDADLYSALFPILVLVLGGEPVWESPQPDPENPEPQPAELVLKLTGTDRAASDVIAGVGPLLGEIPSVPDLWEELKAAGILDFRRPARRVEEASNLELDEARDLAREVLDAFSNMAEFLHASVGRDAAGFGMILAGRRTDRNLLRLEFIRLMVVRGELGFQENFAEFLTSEGPQLKALAKLAREHPRYVKFFSPAGLKELEELPGEERDLVRQQLEDFTNRNPDLLSPDAAIEVE